MHTVSRSRWMPYPASEIYKILTAPEKLVQIINRIESIKILQQKGDHEAEVIAQVDLPGGKFMETPGRVWGVPNQKLVFETTDAKLALRNEWRLESQTHNGKSGTQVAHILAIDLSFLVALWASFLLDRFLGAELDADLTRLENMLAAALVRGEEAP